LRARQLPQLYRVAPPCGPLQLRVALRHAPVQRVECVSVAELEPWVVAKDLVGRFLYF